MKKLFVAFFSLLLLTGFAFPQNDLQPLAVIKINKNETITVKQVKARCEVLEKTNKVSLTVDQRKQVLEGLIEEKLTVQAATKAGISLPDSYVDQYFMQNICNALSMAAVVSEKELNEALKAQGYTLDQLLLEQVGMNSADYKAYIKTQLIAQNYVYSLKQAELAKIAPTDEEIRMAYESNKSSFVWNDMAKTFVILYPKGADADASRIRINELRNSLVDKKKTAEQITLEAEQGAFQASSIILPKTEQYAATVGLAYADYVNLFSQKEGFVSDIVDVGQFFEVIMIQKKYAAKMCAISDVWQPETTITVYDYIREILTQQKQNQYLSVAGNEVVQQLKTATNFERKKTGDALTKLLDWGNN